MSDKALGTTTVTQVAIVVHNIEEKAQAWADVLGMDVPNIIITDTVDKAQTEYRGESTEARAKLAFFPLGQVQLELIEPIGENSTWKEHLDKYGESIHHIAFEIKGMQDKIMYLAGKGVPLVQKGEYTGGRYAYADGMEKLGAVLELLEND